jgi:hypothetical protein
VPPRNSSVSVGFVEIPQNMQRSSKMKFRVVMPGFVLAISALFLPASLSAQGISNLDGKGADQQGCVLPGVTLALHN